MRSKADLLINVIGASFVAALLGGALVSVGAPNPTRVNGVKVEKTKITLDPDSTASEPPSGTGVLYGANGKKLATWNATTHKMEVSGPIVADVNGNGTFAGIVGALQGVQYVDTNADGTADTYIFDPDLSGTARLKITQAAGVASILADLDASGTFVDVTAILKDMTYDGTTYQFDPGHTGVPRLRMSAAAGVGSVEVDTDGSAHYAELATAVTGTPGRIVAFDGSGAAMASDIGYDGTSTTYTTVGGSITQGPGSILSTYAGGYDISTDVDGTITAVRMHIASGSATTAAHAFECGIYSFYPDCGNTSVFDVRSGGVRATHLFLDPGGDGTGVELTLPFADEAYDGTAHTFDADGDGTANLSVSNAQADITMSNGFSLFTFSFRPGLFLGNGTDLAGIGSVGFDPEYDGTSNFSLSAVNDFNADGTTGDMGLTTGNAGLDTGTGSVKAAVFSVGGVAIPVPARSVHQGISLWSDASTGLTTGTLLCATATCGGAPCACYKTDADTVVATVHVLAVSDCATTQTSDFIALCF